MTVRLYQAGGFEDCWRHALEPWFRRQGRESALAERPIVVVTPSQAYAAFLKSHLLNAGLPLFAVHFWSPGNLREFLLAGRKYGGRIAFREELRFLMAVAAGENSGEPLLEALEEDPDELVRTIDLLKAGGYDSKSLDGKLWAETAHRLEKLLTASGLETTQELDWRLSEVEAREPSSKLISSILVTGFSAQHWSLYPLLLGGCLHAEEAFFCLPLARENLPERAWLGTWEERFGESGLVPEVDTEESSRYANLCFNFSMDLPGAPEKSAVDFHLAGNVREEAETIAARACSYLIDAGCRRLGILVPSGSILGREVASILARLEIPFLDSLGFFPAQSSRQSLLNRWLEFQRNQSLPSFHFFLQLRQKFGMDSPGFTHSAERELKEAFGILLTDHIDVLRCWLKEKLPGGKGIEALNRWPSLPELALFAEFLEASLDPLEKLGWGGDLETLAVRAEPLKNATPRPIKRAIFLRWLGDILQTPGRTRHSCGRNPFSPVHLLTYEQAVGQAFSHLISGGLNQGLWPPEPSGSPFLSEDRVAILNNRVIEEGTQGEGHTVVADNFGLLLSPRARIQMAWDGFRGLLESVNCRLAATASLASEGDFHKPALPSELYLKLYLADRGVHLEEKTMVELAEATRQWLPERDRNQSSITPPARERLHRAHIARRNPEEPFGEFEFAYREPPPGGLGLSCKAWETVIMRPASVWLNGVLGVRKTVDFNEPPNWPLATGIWVHEWLRIGRSSGTEAEEIPFRAYPAEGVWAIQVAANAERMRETVDSAFAQSGRTLPDWWESGWSQALRTARSLAESLDSLEGWPLAASEWKLPPETVVNFPREGSIPVSGRIDLLLGKETESDRAPVGSIPLWVIDFKTGKNKPLNLNELQKGKGLQIGLYALALQSLGNVQVNFSLLKPGGNISDQLTLEDLQVSGLNNLWIGLGAAQRSGVLGMIGEVRAKFGASTDYPIATLPIDPEVLRAKWEKTHPRLPFSTNF